MKPEAIDLGAPAPDFALPTADGEVITLTSRLSTAHVALYFLREFS